MIESDKEQFATLIGALCSAYGVEISKPRLMAYWIGLSDVPLPDVSSAVETSIRKSPRLPSPAEIRSVATGTDGLPEKAQLAWLELNRMIDAVGGYGSPRCEDPVLVATIKSLGGWQALCETKQTEFDAFVRPKFLATYQSLFRVEGIRPERLVGIHEQHNQRLKSEFGTNLSLKNVGNLVSEVICRKLQKESKSLPWPAIDNGK